MYKVLFTVVLLVVVSNGYAANYSITDLGTFGGNDSYAMDINDAGQIVGSAEDSSGTFYAFIYEDNNMSNIGTFSGSSYGMGINDSGEVTGYSQTSSGVSHAFYYSDGTMNDLGTIDGYESQGYAINNLSKSVGRAYSSSTNHYAVRYGTDQIDDVFGGTDSIAYDINDAGIAVGTTSFSGDSGSAFYYVNGTMTPLGTLGGSASNAFGINEQSQIVGGSKTASGYYNAFIYENGTMTGLGTLGGSTSYAFDINEQGQVVGYSYYDASDTFHAFLYDDGAMIDLNSWLPVDSDWILQYAYAINEFGDIVGIGINPDGYTRGFILYNNDADRPVTDPVVPEPMTVILLSLSVFGLAKKQSRA